MSNQVPPPGVVVTTPAQQQTVEQPTSISGPPAQDVPPQPAATEATPAQVTAASMPSMTPPSPVSNGLGQQLPVQSDTATLHGHEALVKQYRVTKRYIDSVAKGKDDHTIEAMQSKLRTLAKAALAPGIKKVELVGEETEAPLCITKPDYAQKGNRVTFDRTKLKKLEHEMILQHVGGEAKDIFEHELKITLTGDVAQWFLDSAYIPSYGKPGEETSPVPEGLDLGENTRLKADVIPQLEQLIASATSPEQKEAAIKLLELGTKILLIGK